MVFSDSNPDKHLNDKKKETSKQRESLNQDYFPTGYTMKTKPVDYDKPMEAKVEPSILKVDAPPDAVKSNQNAYSNYVNSVPQENIYDEMFKRRINEISNRKITNLVNTMINYSFKVTMPYFRKDATRG